MGGRGAAPGSAEDPSSKIQDPNKSEWIKVNQTAWMIIKFSDYQIVRLGVARLENGRWLEMKKLGKDFTIMSAFSDIFVKTTHICPRRRCKVKPAGSTPHPGPLPGRGGEGKPVAPSGYALVLRPFSSAGYSQRLLPQMDADERGLGRIRIFNRRELRERRRGRRL